MTGAASEVTTLRRDTNVNIIIIIVIVNLRKFAKRFMRYRANKLSRSIRTDGQLENIMHPAPSGSEGIKHTLTVNLFLFSHLCWAVIHHFKQRLCGLIAD